MKTMCKVAVIAICLLIAQTVLVAVPEHAWACDSCSITSAFGSSTYSANRPGSSSCTYDRSTGTNITIPTTTPTTTLVPFTIPSTRNWMSYFGDKGCISTTGIAYNLKPTGSTYNCSANLVNYTIPATLYSNLVTTGTYTNAKTTTIPLGSYLKAKSIVNNKGATINLFGTMIGTVTNGGTIKVGGDPTGAIIEGSLINHWPDSAAVPTAIAAGEFHALEYRSDETIWAWGWNGYGQLGNGSNSGTYEGINTPVPVLTTPGLGMALSAGWDHSLAIKSDGTVWAWGRNWVGELGNGGNTDSNIPVQVPGLSQVRAIDAGDYHSLAVDGSGTVYAWGDNFYGQLGNGTHLNSNIPVQSLVGDFVSVAAGYGHSKALRSDGMVWAWGRNDDGELGNGSFGSWSENFNGGPNYSWEVLDYGENITADFIDDRYVLSTQNSTQDSDKFVATGITSTRVTDCTLQAHLQAVNPGDLYTAALIFGDPDTYSGYGLEVRSDGLVYLSKRTNAVGTLITTPILLSSFDPQNCWMKFARIGDKVYGKVWTYGDPEPGWQLEVTDISFTDPGVGGVELNTNWSPGVWLPFARAAFDDVSMTTYEEGPVEVSGLTVDTTPEYPGAVTLAAGAFHTLALKSGGTVWAWGDNFYGQLGNGTLSNHPDSSIPVQVPDLTGVVSIAAGYAHSLALKSDGTIWAWGTNTYGQLGDESTTTRFTPVQVSVLTDHDVVAIAAGYAYSLALKSDGTVWAWGNNSYGELGCEDEDLELYPFVPQISHVVGAPGTLWFDVAGTQPCPMGETCGEGYHSVLYVLVPSSPDVTGDGTVILDGTVVLNLLPPLTPDDIGDTPLNLIIAPHIEGQVEQVIIQYQDPGNPDPDAEPITYINGQGGEGQPCLTVNFLEKVYNFEGFFDPINNTDVNVAKAGSAIPIRFKLGGDQGLTIFADGYPRSVQVNCESGAEENIVDETVSAGKSGLSYDPVADEYTYVWKTDKLWSKKCRQLQFKFNDDAVTYKTAGFRFNK